MSMSDFTYRGYSELLQLIAEKGYSFADYEDYLGVDKPCILRHDIDLSIHKALRMARFEALHPADVRSTYFVLLRTDLYNPASKDSIRMLREILDLGHDVGLHFDEKAYPAPLSNDEMVSAAEVEARILGRMLGHNVTAVSMHRPSPRSLKGELDFPTLINSYDQVFFQEFRYITDSRHHWEIDPEDAVRSGRYPMLHILTHPCWYSDVPSTTGEVLADYLEQARIERYEALAETIRNLPECLPAYMTGYRGNQP